MDNKAPFWQYYYDKMGSWLDFAREIETEYRQCLFEGRDVVKYKPFVDLINTMPSTEEKDIMADAMYKTLQMTPLRSDFTYIEPSDLGGIKDARPDRRKQKVSLTEEEIDGLIPKIKGAWYGRVCGCLLGKPVEGWRTGNIQKYAEAQNNWPLTRYLKKDEEKCRELGQWSGGTFIDTVNGIAPSDDDTNYTVTAMKLIERYGKSFKPEDVAFEWITNATIWAYCTAERVAYRNLIAGLKPPESAVYHNPYREFIGAQIRGDYFGYIAPGDPEFAAEMAWRDASISHIKNGIYGEMFVAAALAWAAVCDDPVEVILAGLGEVPKNSRFFNEVNDILELYHAGKPIDEASKMISSRYDEKIGFDWCYTVSNAMIVAAAVLWGNDYTDAVCWSVMQGFDTDCNGATVGSIWGMMHGAESIPEEWTAPTGGRLRTDIKGYYEVSIDEMADTTIRHIKTK
ncbi:MAG: ADP-ribosylglycohydrolase family protein [Clostridiales bacterium]|nr:ADP-ribosylglycohydrolase family protein [Clostridiales bacterium]